MRGALVFLLIFLAPPAAFGADKPVPQDAARMEATAREALAWCRKTSLDAYDRVGKKDPRWDKPARDTLDLFSRSESNQADPRVTDAEIYAAARKAVEAGCDDPMILYLYGRISTSDYPGLEEYTRRLRVASEAMQKSAYPPIRRAYAMLVFLDIDSQREDLALEARKDVERGLDAVMDLLPKSLEEDPKGEFLDFGWFDISTSVIAIRTGLSGDDKAAYDRVEGQLAKAPGAEAIGLMVKGSFFVKWAWKARGGGFAATVDDESFRVFGARLAEARRALERAWELNPVGVTTPNNMLKVELGSGGGDRGAMEKWFERAMLANADNTTACLTKLDWLDPKWYGDPNGDDMVAFGRACAATKNWRTEIMLLGAEAHFRRYRLMETADWGPYLKNPNVWADFEAIYPEYLKHRPDDHVARGKYAMACVNSGHYREAHEQFQRLGDNLVEWRSYPRYPVSELKRMQDEVARYVKTLKP